MAERLKGLLDSARTKLGGLLGDFPQGFNAGAVAGVAGYPGDIAYMLDTAGRALTGQDTQPAAQDFPGTTEYIANKAGYPVPQSFSGQLGAAVGGLLTPGPGDLAKFAPVLSAIPFWHGSPHKYDAVDLSKIGTGEGAQAYGWGYYGADTEQVAREYMKVDPSIPVPPRRTFQGQDLEPGTPEYHAARLASEGRESLPSLRKLVSGWIEGAKPGEPTEGWQKTLEILNAAQKKSDFKQLKPQPYLYQGEYRWPDPAKESATPLTGDDLLDWDRPLSEQPGLKSYLSQSLGDVGPGNANNGGAFSKGSSAPAHIGSNRDVPLNPVVGNRVGGMLDNGKVGNSVVGLVPVDVVDALAGKQLSAEVGLHNQAMHLALPSVNGGNGVPLGVNSASSPVGGVALPSLAEGSRVSGDVVGVPVNTLSAIRAGDFDKATGHDLYRAISDELGSDKAATNYLTSRSVLGIRYLDQMSRDAGEGTRNYVMFDDKGIKLLERNGEPINAAEDFAARRAGKAKPYKEAMGVDTIPAMPKQDHPKTAPDYGILHRPPMRDSGAPLFDVTGGGNVYPDDVYSTKAQQYYGTGDAKLDRDTFRLLQSYRNEPDAPVTIYRAVPANVDANDINAGDWVTINKAYADMHGQGFDGGYKIIKKQVKAKDIYTNGDSIHEWGYDPN